MASHAIWKGSISFGLVSIPIALHPATSREELSFRLLRNRDLSPVNYRRVAEKDGKVVPWDQIVKGYEYEKGKFVVLRAEDFKRVDIEATQTVDIQAFVPLADVSPVYFQKPYYMEPQKGGDRAYLLLRDALEGSGKIGIAKVVIKTRQHLAAVKPQDDGLMLELMHFPAELRDTSGFRRPRESKTTKKELDMARSLIDSMSGQWNPDDYQDDYREALEEMIEDKVARGGKSAPRPAPRRKPANVIDLVAVLQQSLRIDRKSPVSPRAKKSGGSTSSGSHAAKKKRSAQKTSSPRKAAAKKKTAAAARKSA